MLARSQISPVGVKVGCAAEATRTNTTSPQNPGGIFSIENYCGPAPDPAGNAAFLRIVENQPSGNAGYGAYGSASWTASPWVAILTAGGYTREPGALISVPSEPASSLSPQLSRPS